jgi:hypothetical protein
MKCMAADSVSSHANEPKDMETMPSAVKRKWNFIARHVTGLLNVPHQEA